MKNNKIKNYSADKERFAKSKYKNLYQDIYPRIKNLIFKVEQYRCYPHNDDFIDFKKWVLKDLIELDERVRSHNYCVGGCEYCDAYFEITLKH